MEAVNQKVFIPPNKQVLLTANGEPLAPTNRVASYASCGTVFDICFSLNTFIYIVRNVCQVRDISVSLLLN